jgi:hypothetical protein
MARSVALGLAARRGLPIGVVGWLFGASQRVTRAACWEAIWFYHDPRPCHLVVFNAYFDASGHPDDTYAMYVSGFVASEAKWMEWETAWLALLAEFGIVPPFHTTEFEGRKSQYAMWSAVRREEFRRRAIRTFTPPRINKAISYGVVLADLRRLFHEFVMPDECPPEPYAWCGQQVVALVVQWALHRRSAGTLGGRDELAFVFEHGDKHRGKLEQVLERSNILPIFRRKKEIVAFQACDFLAWQHRNWLTKRAGGRLNASPALHEMVRCLAKDSLVLHTWTSLSQEAERQGIPKRTGV